MTGLSRENVDLSPGDLLIFNSLLAHGVRPNHSENRVRMAQYISMYPANQHNEEERKERVRLWNDIEHRHGQIFLVTRAIGKNALMDAHI